jgi:hypothetical protein
MIWMLHCQLLAELQLSRSADSKVPHTPFLTLTGEIPCALPKQEVSLPQADSLREWMLSFPVSIDWKLLGHRW